MFASGVTNCKDCIYLDGLYQSNTIVSTEYSRPKIVLFYIGKENFKIITEMTKSKQKVNILFLASQDYRLAKCYAVQIIEKHEFTRR